MFEPQYITYLTPVDSLRAGAISINTNLTNIKDEIESLRLLVDGTAGENLDSYKLVYASAGKYYIATNNDTALKADVVGITLESITQDAQGVIQFGNGLITNNSWNFTQHVQLFLGSNGSIIEESALTGVEFVKPIGFSITSSTIVFNLQLGYDTNENLIIDGDQIEVDFTPSNYTPTIVAETTSVEHISSHLKGLDLALKAIVDRLTAHNI